MPKYRKKPIEIEAEPYKPGMEDCWMLNGLAYSKDQMEKTKHGLDGEFAPAIRTPKGPVPISSGDMIVTENGERCPVSRTEFAETYEAVEETAKDKPPTATKAAPRKPPVPRKPTKPANKAK